MANRRTLEALMIAAELTGTEFSEAAAQIFVHDLAGYAEDQVLAALTRCRQECKGRLTLADVISRIDDGRPGIEKAWAMLPKNEHESAYWTEEIARAYGVCHSLIEEDPIAARMAFKEAYKDELTLARTNKTPIKWSASFGTDIPGRVGAIHNAKAEGYITEDKATKLLAKLGIEHCPDPKPLLEQYTNGQEIAVRTTRKTAI